MDFNRTQLWRRFLIIAAILAGIFCVFTAQLIRHGFIDHDKTASVPFFDKDFYQIMMKLIDGGFVIWQGDRAILKHSPEYLTEGQAQKAKKLCHLIVYRNNQLVLPRSALMIHNPHNSMHKTQIFRGSVFDRNGYALAWTELSHRGRPVRKYESVQAMFHPLGVYSRIYGVSGNSLEKVLDGYLSGGFGEKEYWFDEQNLQSRQVGADVTLTLDIRLQRSALQILDQRKGAVVIIDLRTGGILVLCSSPSIKSEKSYTADWERLVRSADKPLINRCFKLYYPASTFKIISYATLLMEMGTQPTPFLLCTGFDTLTKIHDLAKGMMDAHSAFFRSSNMYFAHNIASMSLGPLLQTMAERVGFNQSLDLLAEVPGATLTPPLSRAFLEDPDTGDIRRWEATDFRRHIGLIGQGAIGHNTVRATPLQLALLPACVANDGRFVTPHIVSNIISNQKHVLHLQPKGKFTRAMAPATARKIKQGMIDVMEIGTGRRSPKIFFDPGKNRYYLKPGENRIRIRTAGKTGTAKYLPDRPADSLFVGFAPADAPQVAVAVVIEQAGWGSKTAAPIGVILMADALNRLKSPNLPSDNSI